METTPVIPSTSVRLARHQSKFAMLAALSLALLGGSLAWAGQSASAKGQPVEEGLPDKSGYTLFNPTPRELWRPLSPDRPDATESALTLDAGAVAIEASYFDWRHDGGDDAYTVMATNVKVGLTNDIDLHTVFDVYTKEDPAQGEGGEGFGDVQLRLKWNLWGNDQGDTAFALMPFVKIPTGTELSNDEWEGGIILPFGKELADGLGLGLMAQVDAVFDEDRDEHLAAFVHTAVVGLDVTDRLGAFAEYIGIAWDKPYEAYVAGGLTWSASEDLVFDIGAQLGLNDAAEELGVFGGFTVRF